MALPKEPNFKIFDPRRGEDWLQSTTGGKHISTRKHSLLVVDYFRGAGKPPLEPGDFDELIRSSLLETGTLGFFALSPFTNPLRNSQLVSLAQIDVMAGSAIGYFMLDLKNIDLHLGLRNLVSFETLITGSCQKKFRPPAQRFRWLRLLWERQHWDEQYLFTQVENIGCLSLIDGETGVIRIFTKLYQGIDDQMSRLVQRMPS